MEPPKERVKFIQTDLVLPYHYYAGDYKALYLRALKRHDASRWSRFLARAGQIDRIAKGRAPGDEWRELERLLVAVAEPRAMKLMAS